MTEARFLDRAALTAPRRTADGYMVAEVRCARTGCQTYLASEIGLTGDELVTVYRPESAVFDRESMATFAGKPVTMDHPPEGVTADNWRKYAIGDIGERVARDGEFIVVPITLMDAKAIADVETGKREISMGYTTPLAMQDGVAPDGTTYQAVQTGPIRINHLAIVDKARGGENLRIGDGAKARWGASPITIDRKDVTMADAVKTRTVLIDGLSVETTDAGAQALEKLQGQIKAADADHQKAIGAKDAEIAELKKAVETKDGELAAVKKSLGDATSPRAMADAVKRRAALLDAGKKAGMKEEDMDEMEDAAIRRSIVSKSLGDAAKDMSDAAIEGAFAVVVQSLAKKDTSPLASGIKTQDTGNAYADADKAHAEYMQRLKDGWHSKPAKEA